MVALAQDITASAVAPAALLCVLLVLSSTLHGRSRGCSVSMAGPSLVFAERLMYHSDFR
jgi:hypothetical protein